MSAAWNRTRRWMPFIVMVALMLSAGTAFGADEHPQVRSAFSTFFASPDWFGSICIWLLITMSVTVVALSIEGFMTNRQVMILPPDAVAEYEQLVAEKRYPEMIERAAADRSVVGQIMHAALLQAGQGFSAMEKAVEEYADAISAKRLRGLEYLNILGAIGPMVGLFGTVYGMIIAFQAMVTAGGQPKPADLAGGVSTALVNTFWGLIVGIPAIVASALIRNKIDGLMVEVMIVCEQLLAKFKPSKKPAAAPGAPGAKPAAAPAAVKPRPA